MWKYDCFICILLYSFISFATTQKRFEVESLYISNVLILYHLPFSSKKSLSSFPKNTLKNITTSEFLHRNPLKLVIWLTWFVSIESRICFVFPNSGSGIIRIISDCCYYFLAILVLTQGLLIVLRSIVMIRGLFLKREVFILCILTSTVFYQK